MGHRIPFNKPFIAGKELYYIAQAVTLGNLSGDGHFTQRCSEILQDRFGVHTVLMTPSCSAALDLAACLIDLREGDEVIMPSFTFVSAANSVARLGARPVFVDIRPDTLNIDESLIEAALSARTKAIWPMHYAGVGCEMDAIDSLAKKHGLAVVEDAAQGVNAFHANRALGSIGHLGAYSFHETKNYICGEGGALCVNDPRYLERAEILRDKGTNRRRFLRGQVDKYTWVDIGASYIPSELVCAFLYGQLELLDAISDRRRRIYRTYRELLQPLEAEGLLRLPVIPDSCTSNYHMFYILLRDFETRCRLIAHLERCGILAVFHFVPLHDSPMGQRFGHRPDDLPVTQDMSRRLLRLPFFYEISEQEQVEVADEIGNCLHA